MKIVADSVVTEVVIEEIEVVNDVASEAALEAIETDPHSTTEIDQNTTPRDPEVMFLLHLRRQSRERRSSWLHDLPLLPMLPCSSWELTRKPTLMTLTSSPTPRARLTALLLWSR